MAYRTEYLVFDTEKPRGLLNSTERVRDVVRASGITDGFLLVSSMQISSAVYVNDDEPGSGRTSRPGRTGSRHPGTTNTIGPARRTGMPTSSTPSWGTRSSSP